MILTGASKIIRCPVLQKKKNCIYCYIKLPPFTFCVPSILFSELSPDSLVPLKILKTLCSCYDLTWLNFAFFSHSMPRSLSECFKILQIWHTFDYFKTLWHLFPDFFCGTLQDPFKEKTIFPASSKLPICFRFGILWDSLSFLSARLKTSTLMDGKFTTPINISISNVAKPLNPRRRILKTRDSIVILWFETRQIYIAYIYIASAGPPKIYKFFFFEIQEFFFVYLQKKKTFSWFFSFLVASKLYYGSSFSISFEWNATWTNSSYRFPLVRTARLTLLTSWNGSEIYAINVKVIRQRTRLFIVRKRLFARLKSTCDAIVFNVFIRARTSSSHITRFDNLIRSFRVDSDMEHFVDDARSSNRYC